MQTFWQLIIVSYTYSTVAPGTYLPQIIPSAIGLEYPRTISPLTNYVGPVLTKSPDPLPTDLQMWLNGKQDHTVIYVSMGSHMHITEEIEIAIIGGIAETNYSAVWALRKKTPLILIVIIPIKEVLHHQLGTSAHCPQS